MFYEFFCMTHPNRGGHTQKTEKPDFRIRMNRDGSEKKLLILNHIKASIGVFGFSKDIEYSFSGTDFGTACT